MNWESNIKVGAHPINWCNDDMHDLGDHYSFENIVDEAAEAVGKGLVVGLEEGAFDHGGATRLFMQSYCLVKFCHRLSPDAPPETQKPPEGGLKEAVQVLMA